MVLVDWKGQMTIPNMARNLKNKGKWRKNCFVLLIDWLEHWSFYPEILEKKKKPTLLLPGSQAFKPRLKSMICFP